MLFYKQRKRSDGKSRRGAHSRGQKQTIIDIYEGFRLDNDVLAICPNAAATPLLSLDKYNRFTKNC